MELGVSAMVDLDPYEIGQFSGDKDSVLDIKATDDRGRTFQVEMQIRPYPTLRRRMLGNWSTIYAGQLAKGEEDGGHLPVIAIWLVGSGFLPESTWIETWTVRGERTGEVLNEDFLVTAVDLGRWKALMKGPDSGILESGIDRWLTLITGSERIDPESPPPALAGPEYKEALEIMSVYTKEDVERDRYFNRLEYQRMMADMKRDFREEGLAEGRVEGARQRTLADAGNFKRLGVAVDIIAEATGLSKEEVEAL